MTNAGYLTSLAVQLARRATPENASPASLIGTPGHCDTGNDYNGDIGVRISSIFVILVGGFLGAWFPTFARRHRKVGVPDWAFFIAKFFGSGVIIATAFIHLLAPANDALTDPCLTGPITEYDWVEGIALMTIFVLFFVELMVMRYANFEHHHHDDDDEEEAVTAAETHTASDGTAQPPPGQRTSDIFLSVVEPKTPRPHSHRSSRVASSVPGDNHFSHQDDHVDNDEVDAEWKEHGIVPESYTAQLTAVFVLEFGVVFHSIFIGLTLAVTSVKEFPTLYVVLVFHQTFEGLGLGSRLASIPWPKSKRWTPYLLAAGYSLSTPIAIAVGLGVRTSYPPNSQTTLITNGVFDSISAGILIYTGLVELMAHEFMFSSTMQRAPIKVILSAFFVMCLGAGLMALLGKWA